MKPHKPANDVKDKSDARNSPQAHLGRIRPLSPFQNENRAADGFIPPHGGYESLLSFQKARIVYDGTVRFCERFLDKRDRTYDQMVQAARSGKQNILEGSEASGTSKETEIKLTGVARPVWVNCSKTTATSCGCAARRNGPRSTATPNASGNSAAFVSTVRVMLSNELTDDEERAHDARNGTCD